MKSGWSREQNAGRWPHTDAESSLRELNQNIDNFACCELLLQTPPSLSVV